MHLVRSTVHGLPVMRGVRYVSRATHLCEGSELSTPSQSSVPTYLRSMTFPSTTWPGDIPQRAQSQRAVQLERRRRKRDSSPTSPSPLSEPRSSRLAEASGGSLTWLGGLLGTRGGDSIVMRLGRTIDRPTESHCTQRDRIPTRPPSFTA